jgi:RNA polymerase-binding protein DksA
MQPEADEKERQAGLERMLRERRRDAEARYRKALEEQQSGAHAGDSEGVHGWKAAREGGADVALLQSLDQTVKQIDAALSRLRHGQYGMCAKCGEPIPLGRLQALPFATLCVPCQSQREGVSR